MRDPRLLFLAYLHKTFTKAKNAGDWDTCKRIEPVLIAMYKDLGNNPHVSDRHDVGLIVGFIEPTEEQEEDPPAYVQEYLRNTKRSHTLH